MTEIPYPGPLRPGPRAGYTQAWFVFIDPAHGEMTTDRNAPHIAIGATHAGRVRLVVPDGLDVAPAVAEHVAGRITEAARVAGGGAELRETSRVNLTADEVRMVIAALTSSASELCRGNHGSVSEEYAAKYRDLARRLGEESAAAEACCGCGSGEQCSCICHHSIWGQYGQYGAPDSDHGTGEAEVPTS